MACVNSGDNMALEPAPTTVATSDGAEAYVPVVEPVSPAQPYRAPTPTDRSPLTLKKANCPSFQIGSECHVLKLSETYPV